MKHLLLLLMCLFFFTANGQGKRLWAKSFINKKAPELVVDHWISKKPDTTGKFVLIDFWATWCGWCKKLIPELNDYQKNFKKNLVVIGLSDETAQKVKSLKTPKINYYIAVDPKARMKKTVGVHGIPHCMLIDPKGVVRWEGWPQLKGHELTAGVIKSIITKYK